MRFLPVMAALCALAAPARSGVSLGWAPVLSVSFEEVRGPAREIARGFDGDVLRGLEVRVNEVAALSRAGVRDLQALRRLRRAHGPAIAGVPPEHIADLERTLVLLSPIVERLESRGVKVDERGRASTDLTPLLSQALVDEAREAERAAETVVARYDDAALPLDRALANSRAADALIGDRYPYLSIAALDRLARVYDPRRTPLLARRAQTEMQEVAVLSASDRAELRDAVGDPPRTSPTAMAALLSLARRIW